MSAPDHPIRFVAEAAGQLDLCWPMGWNEATAGNLSRRLPTGEVQNLPARALPDFTPDARAPLPIAHPELDGDWFPVTGSGRFFRRAVQRPDMMFGIDETEPVPAAFLHHLADALGDHGVAAGEAR